ncbi:penicillin-binding protein activator [Sodalis-like symbiont of Philaenus spumarius]|nr:penicillin-binding protein activator [Sodalis-like symbiont of Philaenus spumarius]
MLSSYVLGFKTECILPVVLASLILTACTAQGPENQTGRAAIPANAAALQQITSSSFDASQRLSYTQAMIDAGERRPSLDLVRTYIAEAPLLTDAAARQQNIDKTWQTLVSLPSPQSNLVINADENILQGWLDLLCVYQDNLQYPTLLQAAIKDWQTRYPQNPAAKTLPTPLSQVQNYSSSSVGGIALLLPLNGQAQVFSNAIQQGFSAAKNGLMTQKSVPEQDASAAGQSADGVPKNDGTAGTEPAGSSANQNGPVSAPGTCPDPAVSGIDGQPSAGNGVPVKVYDTSSQPLPVLLAQAQQDGASMIIGPLLKSDIEQLYNDNAGAASSGTLNILALNQPEHLQPRPNICYFALSPEDEARDAANHIHQQGRQQPLLLLPRGALGDRIAKVFSAAWRQAGGATVLEQRFGSSAELKQNINSGDGIPLTGTPLAAGEAPANAVVTIPAPQNNGAVSPSGGAIDAVYIIAIPDELALIKPMIDMRVSSRARLALYASSRSYQADAEPDYRLEMEGLEFSDIPLLTGAHPALLSQISAQLSGDYSLVRLYAMGMDAWVLANHFSEIRQIPSFQVAGETGTLSATPDCVINRTLSWLKYQRGQLIAVHRGSATRAATLSR